MSTAAKPPSPPPHVAPWVLRYARRSWRGLVVLFLVLLPEIALAALAPWPMQIIIDDVLGHHEMPPMVSAMFAALPGGAAPMGVIAWCLGATVLLFLASAALGMVQTWVSIGLGQRMVYDLAADLFAHLQRLSLRFHSRRSVGDTIRRVTADCGSMASIIRDAALPAVTATLTLGVMFVIMVRMDATLALLSAAVLPLLAVVVVRFSGPIMDRGYDYAEAEGAVYDLAEQTLSAMPVIQAYALEDEAEARLRRGYDAVLATALRATAVQFKLKVWSGLVISLATASILAIGATAVVRGDLTLGGLLVFLAYLNSLYAPVETVIQSQALAREAAGSARRVVEILEEREDVVEAPEARRPLLGTGTGPEIVFDRVTFGYEPKRPVLKEISFRALPGSTTAIVGPSGAGKTTLIGLISRLADPWTGAVRIAGEDLRELTIKDVRERVAFVLQDSFLFPVTIAENIAWGRPGATRDEVVAAARAASADAFIRELPDGYDSLVGERGATLSGGQRQRIAIARALLKNAPILVLDEPTSALDAATETSLIEALELLRRGRTTFVIAHRLSTIRAATQVIVMENGCITACGTHQELMRGGGLYPRLVALQTGASLDSNPESAP